MGFRTLVKEAQDQLKTQIEAQTPTGVPVSLGYPAGGVQAPAHIIIEGGVQITLPYVISGGALRDENTALQVQCIVTVTTDQYTVARDAALVLAGYVEDAVTADPTLNGLVAYAGVTAIELRESVPDESTRQVSARLTISYDGTDAV